MGQQQGLSSFINNLANVYTRNFDVYRDEKLGDIPLAFLAHYHRRDERYMISKRIRVYGTEHQQLIFATVPEEPLTKEFLTRIHKQIFRDLDEYTIKHEEHMSTVIHGMIITDRPVSEEIEKEVRRFRKLKFLKFGFHGWAELYFVIVHPGDQDIIVHSKGRPFVADVEKLLREGNVAR